MKYYTIFMNWIFFALLSVAFSATYSLISKKLLTDEDDHDPVAYASTLFGAVAIIGAAVYAFTSFDMNDFTALSQPDVLWFVFLNVLFYSIAPSFYYRALKHLPASEVSILFDLTTLYIMIFSVSFGVERFSIWNLLGGICIISAAIVVTLASTKMKFSVTKYFWMMMIATVMYAIAAIVDNIIISRNYLSPLFFQVISFGIPAVLVLMLNPRSRHHLHKLYIPRVYKYIFLNAVFFYLAFWAIYQAYFVGGTPSQVNFMTASETVVTVFLAAFLLKEKDHFKAKLIAAALASLGIFLLS